MNDLIAAMTYSSPTRIPVSVSILPAVWLKHGDEFMRLALEYPDLLPKLPDLNRLDEFIPPTYHTGTFTDEWGCVWSNVEEGMESIVTGHPVPRREDILTLEIPSNEDGLIPHGFMYLRLLDLRGFEEAMLDFAEECDELQILINKVLNYNKRQIQAVLPRSGEIVFLVMTLECRKVWPSVRINGANT
ncbi:MAG: hypothetical protein PHV32_10080 [Eubacteriales bacterium]|nr:hypothetical protein [Eubacteriales bacterium]